MNVACVLRSGGPYDASYVERLCDGVERHLPGARFVCLSDVDVPCERIPLETAWPRNWAKIELFRPGLWDGPVLYLDLDTDVIGDLSEVAALADRPGFWMLDDWLKPGRGASGVMVFREGASTRAAWGDMAAAPYTVPGQYRRDQDYIFASMRHMWCDLRAALPGQIVSRWVESRHEVPADARLVCWHGEPRPHEIEWAPTGHLDKRDPRWESIVQAKGY